MADARLTVIFGLVAFLAALIYVFATPLWQAPDEPSHLGFIKYLQDNHSLPSPLESKISTDILESARKTLRWPIELRPLSKGARVLPAEDFAYRGLMYTANHPPLYYISAQFFSQIGAARTRPPLTGLAYGARIFSALLASLTVALAYKTSRLLDLAMADSATIASLVLLQPQFMFIASSINNDSLTIFLFSLLIFYALVEIRRPSKFNPLICGIILGLGLITKVTFWLALPIIWLAFLLSQSYSWPVRAGRATGVTALALVISGWWYVRNYMIFGKLWYAIGGTGLGKAHLAEFFTVSRFYQWLWQSYWGRFGWMTSPLPDFFFIALLVIVPIALIGAGLSLFSRRSALQDRRSLILLLAVSTALFLGAIWFRVVAQTGQGRYLFPAIIPTTMLLWLGLKFWVCERWQNWLAVGLLGFFSTMTVYGLSLILRL